MRVTRAAIRILEDEAEQAAHVPLPSTPRRERAPLGDITGSIQNDALEVIAVVDPEKPIEKTPGKLSPRKDERCDADDDTMEVLEDDDESETSSAAEEACRELLRPTLDPEVYRLQVRGPGRPSTPPSKAVKRARKNLNPKSRTPRFNPKVHASPDVLRSPTRAERLNSDRRDSFLDAIKPRSPDKTTVEHQPTVEEEEVSVQEPEVVQEEAPDKSQEMETPIGSPATVEAFRKRRSRIEDSFDALDAMEDMLDEVKESLANVDRPRTATSTSPDNHRHAQIQQDALLNVSKSAPQTPRARSMDTRTKSQDRASLRVFNDTLRRTASTRSSSKPVSTVSTNSRSSKLEGNSSARSPARATTKPVSLPSRPKATVSSITKKPFVPEKSQKAPTTSTFKLPGEAISARIKAQREARQAGNSSVGSTSANPSSSSDAAQKRKSTGPEVRMTAAALARLNIARGEKPAPATSTKRSSITAKPAGATAAAASVVTTRAPPTTRATALTSSTAARLAARKPATRSAAATTAATTTKPPPKRTVNPAAGASATRTTVGNNNNNAGQLKRSSSTRSIGSLPAAKRRVATEAATTTEGTSKTTTATKTTTTTKVPLNDRAEAARRARVEAAERGRQASRLWAEKMRKRRSGIVDGKAAESVANAVAAAVATADAGATAPGLAEDQL